MLLLNTMLELLELSCNPLIFAFAICAVTILAGGVYLVTFHPLSHIPGPILPKLTSLWLYYHCYIGDECTIIHAAHARYGPFVRIAPNQVDVSDADAVPDIYVVKGGFEKAPCYDIDGHKTIFSTTDTAYRTPRAKAVVPMFSTKSIRENEVALYACVDRMVERMKKQSSTRKPVNILNLTRSMAVDVVSTHLFQENYDGTSEKGNRLSVSAFVDAFVAVGRFFYLPTPVFLWLEWAIEKLLPDERTATSMKLVDNFVETLFNNSPPGAQNYPGRLRNIGLEKPEVISQCKDLIFAGTDSTGMNLATICRQLTLHPDKYERLRLEILNNSQAGIKKKDIQALPYLSAAVKEVLRISMANPTRLPHIVPSGGWNFKSVSFPAGTLVGCSAYELHLNGSVFPNPFAFQPERWLPGNVTSEANKSFFAFGAGIRSCIARNLATIELFMGTEKIVESDVLRGAKICQEKVEIYEWFNSSVKGEKIELIWEEKI